MTPQRTAPWRVAFQLDLEWTYKRHTGVFAGAQRYAEEQGWESTIDDYVSEKFPANGVGTCPYDGVIGRASKRLAERSSRLGVPVVNVWRSSPAWRDLPGVFPDFDAAGRMRAQHLLTRGLRRFAILEPKGSAASIEGAAFKATVREAGFSCMTAKLPLRTDSHAHWQKFEKRIAGFMEDWEPPIGVFGFDERVGRTVAQMCRLRGWRVPHDVAIITGTNEESLCELPRPSLTSVEFGFERIGYQAAQLLDRLMNGEPPPEAPIEVPPEALVVRESTDFFAVEDPLMATALEFIATNSRRPIGAEDVARAVNVGLRTLQRQFREYLDRPVSEEIQRVRIERAKRELAQSRRPISQIARDSGFGRPMRMSEAFRRELGVTPREYRKKQRMDPGG